MSGRTVLVVAAHGDDEVLGCGGTMARHASAGDRVEVVLVADGVSARGGGNVEARETAAREAARALGARPPRFLGLPDNRLDSVDLLDVVQAIEAVLDEVVPDIVYTHHAGDLNIDHATVHRAVLTACRPVPGQTVHALYGFEVLSSTEWTGPDLDAPFVPARFTDIAAHLETKRAALGCYEAEMRPFPHARSLEAVEALARLRGSQVGLDAAEAFTVLRRVVTD